MSSPIFTDSPGRRVRISIGATSPDYLLAGSGFAIARLAEAAALSVARGCYHPRAEKFPRFASQSVKFAAQQSDAQVVHTS
jgi:hypothetical protein